MSDGGFITEKSEEIAVNSQKVAVSRETVIKVTAVAAIAALMFGLILVFNGMIGYAADDYLYFFKYTGHVVKGTPERLTGIRDIFTGMVTHYKICNGRIPAHFLLQLFTLFDKSVFNVVNSLFFTLLGLLIYFHANYKRPINIPLLVFIYAFEWLGMTKPASAYIWYSAAFNYLWTTVWILTFLMFYRIHDTESEKPKISKEILLSVLMLIAGIFAGWTNENMGGATMGAVILFLIYFRIKKMPVRAHHFTGLLGVIFGFGILLLAPGNRVRIDNTHRERNIMKHLQWSIKQVVADTWRAVLLMLAVLIVVLLIVCIKRKKLTSLTGSCRAYICSQVRRLRLFLYFRPKRLLALSSAQILCSDARHLFWRLRFSAAKQTASKGLLPCFRFWWLSASACSMSANIMLLSLTASLMQRSSRRYMSRKQRE